jgi:hypothetical protein
MVCIKSQRTHLESMCTPNMVENVPSFLQLQDLKFNTCVLCTFVHDSSRTEVCHRFKTVANSNRGLGSLYIQSHCLTVLTGEFHHRHACVHMATLTVQVCNIYLLVGGQGGYLRGCDAMKRARGSHCTRQKEHAEVNVGKIGEERGLACKSE